MKLTLFFTYGVSLKTWAESGLLERELALYKRLAGRSVQVTFVTWADHTDYDYADIVAPIRIVPCYCFARKFRNRWLALAQSLFLHRKLPSVATSADIFKTNQMKGAWVPLLVKRKHHTPLLLRTGFDFYQDLKRQNFPFPIPTLARLLSKISYARADAAIVTTPQMADFAVKTYNASRRKISIIPNFIDTDLFRPMDYEPNGRILFVGRLSPEKNLPMLIKAAADADMGLDIVGDGPLRSQLTDLAKSQNANVKFLGIIGNSQLPEIINRYPIFVQPSRYEGHPKTLLEAMACARTVIGSDVPGIRNVIRHRATGLLVPPEPRAITDAILRAASDTSLQHQLGRSARRYILDNCSLDKVVEMELALYADLSGLRPDPPAQPPHQVSSTSASRSKARNELAAEKAAP